MFHSVNADVVRKNRSIPSDNLFKPTKTDTILYGWPLPSKVDSEFGADSEAPTIGFSRPIQIVLRVTFRWCKLVNPSVRNGFEISTYLAYVIFISRDISGSHSLIEVVPSSSFSGILRSTPQRHHVVVWPTEEIALNVWSGWMVLLYISGPSWLPPKRNLVFFSPPNWALKTSSNGKVPNFEARQNRWYSVVASSKRVTPWNWQLLPARKLHQKIQSGLAVSFQGIFPNFHPVYIDKSTPWPIKSKDFIHDMDLG